MSRFEELVPAYGRDYKNGKEAEAAFLTGKDWIIASFFSPWRGKPVNMEQLCRAGDADKVVLRFKGLRQTKVIDLKKVCKDRGFAGLSGCACGLRTCSRRRRRGR